MRDVPRWELRAHFAEVGVVADVVTDTVFIDIGMDLRLAGEFFCDLESFKDRAGIRLAAQLQAAAGAGACRLVDQKRQRAGCCQPHARRSRVHG